MVWLLGNQFFWLRVTQWLGVAFGLGLDGPDLCWCEKAKNKT
jgi:hypothetical protein